MRPEPTIGIIGGSGMLGRAIALGLLQGGRFAQDRFWVSNRSGQRHDFADWPKVTVTADSFELCKACDVVVISVPPTLFDTVAIEARDCLVISVMAGVPLTRISQRAGTQRVVRAMSNPAAELGLAYSPWFAESGMGSDDRLFVDEFFSAIGLADEVPRESDIEHFTALTGSVPGFVALFAQSITSYAEKNGINRKIAERAMRQLFLAAGQIMSKHPASAADHVEQMMAYAGTTAAGIAAMRDAGIDAAIEAGLEAASQTALNIGA